MFDFYPRYEEWFARGQLICFMLGMGVNLPAADFLRIARQPRSFCFGFVGQVFVIPLAAVAVNHLFDLAAPIALGLILVSAMPGGTLSKVFVYVGRGNAALTITLSAVSTVATLVTVPATLRLLAADYVPDDFDMPVGGIIADVGIFLLAPLALGIALGRVAPSQRIAIARWSLRLGFVIVAVMIVGALGSGRISPGEHGLRVPLAIILFCVLGQQLNMLPFYVLPMPRADRLAVGIEVTMRNMNLALLLNASLFKSQFDLHDGVNFVVLFYAAVALGAGLPLAFNHRRLSRKELAPSRPAAKTEASQ
jgi:bile acid:Na+ symporter, BASS family